MYKLIFVTVLGFVTVLAVFGESDGHRIEAAAANAAEAAPAPEGAPTDIALVTNVVQTTENLPRFAGPALRPSPEHAGEAPAEDLSGKQGQTLYVTAASVNFRAGPSTSNDIVGSLARGQSVTAMAASEGDWIEIRDGQGRSGFISAKFLSGNRP